MNYPGEQLIEELVRMRRHLHQHPELSGQEYKTAKYLGDYLSRFDPTIIHTGLAGGTGMLAIWDSGKAGKTIFFRTELDALPITEVNKSDHQSIYAGISHKCGHDGHMVMVAGLAPLLQEKNFSGKIGLLFQPAEETGEGAAALMKDEIFTKGAPDYIFGVHNLPGFRLGEVVVRNGSFCAASRGMKIIIEGRTSHAAEPEKAHSPAALVGKLIQELPQLPNTIERDDLSMITLTHVQLGEPGFGITPGHATVHATLRAFSEADMNKLVTATEKFIADSCSAFHVAIEYRDVFPVTYNHSDSQYILTEAATRCGLKTSELENPFRWSEDFGYYSAFAKTIFFGLGSGIEQHNLHHPMYDFPDALIPFGVRMYTAVIDVVCGK